MKRPILRLGIAAALTFGTAAAVASPASAWGDHHICDNGVDHKFGSEAAYNAFLDAHSTIDYNPELYGPEGHRFLSPGVTEGTCQTTTTSTSPATTVPATSVPTESTLPAETTVSPETTDTSSPATTGSTPTSSASSTTPTTSSPISTFPCPMDDQGNLICESPTAPSSTAPATVDINTCVNGVTNVWGGRCPPPPAPPAPPAGPPAAGGSALPATGGNTAPQLALAGVLSTAGLGLIFAARRQHRAA